MNTLPPNEPLDDQEREFARILHALPSGEPSPALDAKILRAATNAAASSKRPVRRMLASAGALWGIGSAAAAVLALGVAWQMKYGGADHTYVSRAPQAQKVSDTAEEDSVAVELSSQPADAAFVPPPPPPMESAKPMAPASPKLRAPSQAQPGRAAAAAAPAAAEPEAFARDHLDEHVSQAGDDRSLEASSALAAKEAAAQQARNEAQMEMKAKAADSEREQAARLASNAAPAPPPPPVAAAAPAAPAAAAAAGGRADLGYTSGSLSTRAQSDKTEAAANRKPGTWLADIRKLRDQGRLDEARASLVEFRKKYPKWVIPTDLAPLQPE